MMQQKLGSLQQENLVVILAFDDERCKVIRNTVELDLFEGEYQEIVRRIYKYIDEYKEPPKEHLADLFSDILEGDDKRKNTYDSILRNIFESQDTVNVTYVMNSLTKFIRQQLLKNSVIEAGQLLLNNDPDALEEIESKLHNAMKRKLTMFEPGLRITNTSRSLSFLDNEDPKFQTGIPALDNRNLGPGRKELHLFIALAKRGKTWWMTNIGKRSLMHRQKVCHITLEVSEEVMAKRYYQALFSVPNRNGKIEQTILELDDLGRLYGLDKEEIKPKFSWEDPDAKQKIIEKMGDWGLRLDNLIIKQFPTGQLTVNELSAYLDNLETTQKFIPDVLIIDYPDLMRLDTSKYRLDLGRIYVDLRGLAVERNLALVAATQSNREGLKKSKLTEENVGEDFSKIATADTVLTYSQTDDEKELGLARIFVSNGRNEEDKFTVLITQNYAIGQFVLDSVRLSSMDSMKLGELVEDVKHT